MNIFNPFVSHKRHPSQCGFEIRIFRLNLKKDEIQFLNLNNNKKNKTVLPIIFFKRPLISNNTIEFIKYLKNNKIISEMQDK